jgi:hypothetical protein
MSDKIEPTESERSLLQSLMSGPKHLHMGVSPISAIEACFKMIDYGWVEMKGDLVIITKEGKEVLRGRK